MKTVEKKTFTEEKDLWTFDLVTIYSIPSCAYVLLLHIHIIKSLNLIQTSAHKRNEEIIFKSC